jgi:hypothetical protein
VLKDASLSAVIGNVVIRSRVRKRDNLWHKKLLHGTCSWSFSCVRLALPTLEGWAMHIAFQSLSLYLGAPWSSGRLSIMGYSFWGCGKCSHICSNVNRLIGTAILVDQAEMKNFKKLSSCQTVAFDCFISPETFVICSCLFIPIDAKELCAGRLFLLNT